MRRAPPTVVDPQIWTAPDGGYTIVDCPPGGDTRCDVGRVALACAVDAQCTHRVPAARLGDFLCVGLASAAMDRLGWAGLLVGVPTSRASAHPSQAHPSDGVASFAEAGQDWPEFRQLRSRSRPWNRPNSGHHRPNLARARSTLARERSHLARSRSNLGGPGRRNDDLGAHTLTSRVSPRSTSEVPLSIDPELVPNIHVPQRRARRTPHAEEPPLSLSAGVATRVFLSAFAGGQRCSPPRAPPALRTTIGAGRVYGQRELARAFPWRSVSASLCHNLGPTDKIGRDAEHPAPSPVGAMAAEGVRANLSGTETH